MSTPVDEKGQPDFSAHHLSNVTVNTNGTGKSEDEGTVIGDGSIRHPSPAQNPPENRQQHSIQQQQQGRHRSNSHLTVDYNDQPANYMDPLRTVASPSQVREQAHRLNDDLAMLQVERQVSRDAASEAKTGLSQSRSMHRSRSRRPEPLDEFDAATNPLHETTAVYKPPEAPNTNIGRIFKRIHESSFLVRYFIYITPVVLIILIPLLLGALLFDDSAVGGVKMEWFCVWLLIVWLSLWAGRILAKILPWPMGAVASLFTNNSKKWRDMGKQLELPATFFFWWLAIEISFLPTMTEHHTNGNDDVQPWENTMNKVLVSLFVGFTLNFIEKIIIQLIAISFHLRTYADRIELNKFQINSLTKLYQFSKEKIHMEDREFEAPSGGPSGARTPGQLVKEAQRNTMAAVNKFGDVAGKIAGDFAGREVAKSTHPHQVVLTLLSSTSGSQVLARRLYRTFAREETETVYSEDLRNAFENDDEADAAFSMFDKDMNGDISMEELEAVCVEIGRERKSITASLKDLDSVVSKLDDVFMFVVVVITILVFISLISTSAAGVLTSAGSTILALSWLFSATAQEFLQSIIFVFVKHPFDVGDRVGIYGSTGSQLKGDDYFVKEISLLYTEFKKMEGHVVQAPNSYLNTLFILNQRRSGGLAEAVPIVVKFGTTLDQIDGLRQKLLDFVKSEKREYQGNILTELREVAEAHSLTINIVFFYKSNWQNELLRLQRRNKFICALMVSMQELGIEGPRMRYPGQKESFPVYLQNVPHVSTPGAGHGGTPDNPTGMGQEPPFVAPSEFNMDDTTILEEGPEYQSATTTGVERAPSSAIRRRPRAESLAQMSKRVDFSLGMSGISASDMTGDVYSDRKPIRLPISVTSPSPDPSSKRGGSSTGRGTSKTSHDHHRDTSASHQSDDHSSGALGRTGSLFSRRPNGGMIQRIGTDSSMARQRSTHRNRFFGPMGRASLERERERAANTFGRLPSNLSRSEKVDEQNMMEMGMADIPESKSGEVTRAPTPGGLGDSGSEHTNIFHHGNLRGNTYVGGPLDPRSGLVSPAAWREEERAGGPLTNPAATSPGSLGNDGGTNALGHSCTGSSVPAAFGIPAERIGQGEDPDQGRPRRTRTDIV